MKLLEWLEAIWKAFTPPKQKRLELRCVSYREADALLKSKTEEWRVAKEENGNRQYGFVYLERLEPYPRFSQSEVTT